MTTKVPTSKVGWKELDNGFDDNQYEFISSDGEKFISKCRIILRSLWLGFIFYSRFSIKEMKRHLFNFIIGILSCTITVFVAATISTIVDNAPFVILKQAENSCGQYDISISPRSGPYLNYSLITYTLSKNSQKNIAKLSAPRYLFNDTESIFFSPKCIERIDNFQINRTDNLYDQNDCKPNFIDTTICKSHLSSLWIIDFEKENDMGFGGGFPKHLIPKKGEIVINRKQFKAFNIKINDYLLLSINLDNGREQNLLYSMIRDKIEIHGKEDYKSNAEYIAKQAYCSRILFPVKVIGVIDEISFGKFGSNMNKFTFIMSCTHFMEYIHEYSNEYLSQNPIFDNLWRSSKLTDLSTHIFFNIPNRINIYKSLNYKNIQHKFAVYSSNIMYFLGFTQIYISTPIEEEFYKLRFGAMFFQLILDIILLTLVLLSIMLLYSLLIISVDTRTFELGILRMIGLNRKSIIKLLINQSLSYSLPSWIFGIIISEIAIYYLLIQFSDLIGYTLQPIISINGWWRATAVGIFIPLISSILPIKNALNKNLHHAIDTNHNSGPEIIEYKIERSEQSEISHIILIVAIILVIFGVSIYYLFPLALITQQLSLLLTMFFALLISMLIGLLILSFNIQHLIEKGIIIALIGWWESKEIPHIVYKNMIAHKHRNKKTTLMYSASLGFIIMISVVYRVQINSIGLSILTQYGAKYFVSFKEETWRYTEIENKFKDTIETITYQWKPFRYLGHKTINAEPLNKIFKTHISTTMISPDYLNVAEKSLFSFISNKEKNNINYADRIDHQLYSAKGSQSAIIGYTLKSKLYLNDDIDEKIIIEFPNKANNIYKIIKSLAYIQVYPGYQELNKITFGTPTLAMSIPSILRWDMLSYNKHTRSIEDHVFVPRGILIKFWKNATSLHIEQVNQYVNEYGYDSFDYDDFMIIMKSSNDIMDKVFSVSTYIALFLCLFSVISSMYVNIYEQSKEVAVLRAIGLNKFQTMKVYLYEATVLILSSCIMGIAIGILVGFTMTAQIALYASYPINFDMPYHLLIIILCASFLSAFISVILPLIQLLSQTVSHVMRVNF